MTEIKLCNVEPGMIAVKVFKFDPPDYGAMGASRTFEPVNNEVIVLPLTCEPGNTLHAALYEDTLYYWFDRDRRPTAIDQDRWQVLTGEPLRF